jgi:hypothetical protein
MQNSDNLDLTVYDPNSNDWSFTQMNGTGEVTFILEPSGTFMLNDTSIVVEIAGFVAVQQPCSTTVAISEQVSGTRTGSLTITTFPVGFFFDALGAWVQNGSNYEPAAQVFNGTSVQLQWDSSADNSQITIYMSGQPKPFQPEDIGLWNSPPLTQDTVFTVSVSSVDDELPPLTLTVPVKVPNADILANSLSAAESVSAPNMSAFSLNLTGPLTMTNGLGQWQPLDIIGGYTTYEGVSTSNWLSFEPTGDGFVFGSSSGWYDDPSSTNGWLTLECYTAIGPTTTTGSNVNQPTTMYATGGNFLIPVSGGSTFSIQYWLDLATVGSRTNLFVQVYYIPFGNGKVVPTSDSDISAELRAKLASRTERRSLARV